MRYQRAAEFVDWSLTQSDVLGPHAYAFEAEVVSESLYWIQEHPLSLVLFRGKTEWMWAPITVTRDGTRVAAVVEGFPIVKRP